ncbi:MAG: hypothetical protein H6553_10930 [Chitinophagales bacterium]|nr:hypothetical protein [Chitinophagales bacterium]
MRKRVKIKSTKDSLSFILPLRKSKYRLLIMIAASILWCFGLFYLIRYSISGHGYWTKVLLLLIIASWSFIGTIGVSIFIWMFFGRERVIITNEYLITDKPLIFFYRRNFYPIQEISNLRIDKEIYKVKRNQSWIERNRTVLKFNTPNKEVVFARGIEQQDAELVLLELAQHNFFSNEQLAVIHHI